MDSSLTERQRNWLLAMPAWQDDVRGETVLQRFDQLTARLTSATEVLQKIRQMDHDEFRATNDAELVFGMAHDAGAWLKENAPDA